MSRKVRRRNTMEPTYKRYLYHFNGWAFLLASILIAIIGIGSLNTGILIASFILSLTFYCVHVIFLLKARGDT